MGREALKPQLRAILITLLTRLQTSKTDKYVYLFAYFILYTTTIQVNGLDADAVISATEEVQPGYAFISFLLPPPFRPAPTKSMLTSSKAVVPGTHQLRHPADAEDAAEGSQGRRRRDDANAHGKYAHGDGSGCSMLVRFHPRRLLSSTYAPLRPPSLSLTLIYEPSLN
jgi:hypothetical protein